MARKTHNLLRVQVAGNRAASHDFTLDVLVTNDTTVLRNGDLRVSVHCIALAGGVAVSAGVEGRALAILGLVLLASDIRNAIILVNPTEGSMDVTSVAGASSSAVQKNLNGRNRVSRETLGKNLLSISDG